MSKPFRELANEAALDWTEDARALHRAAMEYFGHAAKEQHDDE